MAQNIRQLNLDRIQIGAVANAHTSGDICWEGNGTTGWYGIAIEDASAGKSMMMYIKVIANVPVPSGTVTGNALYSAPQPTGAIVLTLTATGNVKVGVAQTDRDSAGNANVLFDSAFSAGQ